MKSSFDCKSSPLFQLAWHQNEYTLNDLHCGREYHLYVVLHNGIGPSATSKVLTARTLGSRPTGPNEADLFVQSNTTYLSLKLDTWSDHRCEILYFVVEYKLAAVDTWSTGKLHICRRGLEEESLEIIK